MDDASLNVRSVSSRCPLPLCFSTDHRAALGEMGLARIFSFLLRSSDCPACVQAEFVDDFGFSCVFD